MSEIYHVPQSALYLRRGPFSRPAEPTLRRGPFTRRPAEPTPDAQVVVNPRVSDPVVADGFVWLVGMLWQRWSAKWRSQRQASALDPSIQEQAVQRRLHRLAREI